MRFDFILQRFSRYVSAWFVPIKLSSSFVFNCFYFSAPILQPALVFKQLKMEGFLVFRWQDRYEEGLAQLQQWVKEGKLKYKETVTNGFENTFEAFVSMLQGNNIGKAVVKI